MSQTSLGPNPTRLILLLKVEAHLLHCSVADFNDFTIHNAFRCQWVTHSG